MGNRKGIRESYRGGGVTGGRELQGLGSYRVGEVPRPGKLQGRGVKIMVGTGPLHSEARQSECSLAMAFQDPGEDAGPGQSLVCREHVLAITELPT